MAKDPVKQQLWESKLKDYEESGLSAPAWCKARGENLHTFKYWRDKLKKCSGGVFEEIGVKTHGRIELSCGDIKIKLDGDLHLLELCLLALRKSRC